MERNNLLPPSSQYCSAVSAIFESSCLGLVLTIRLLEGDPCYDCWRAYFELGELKHRHRHRLTMPEWLPKSEEELEEVERARMTNSLHTRLLRVMGRSGRTD
ncbi:uncharacterized protein LOC130755329 [Actinidia eriantha]|uniref:uncharacterized protein LOC130755329 n=1 Tax=Actinidia eriantha TaxID=165200 RepID=UPI0025900A31|nr:uncharacterized protein LOC130755329 [Actinidia eriantha]